MGVIGLHHAQITVPVGAEDAARGFYCGLLGLVQVPKPDTLAGRGGFWLAVGGQAVHVGVEEGVDRGATKAHVAYEVDDLEGIRARLEDAGFRLSSPPPIPGFERVELRDPFGNRLELLQASDSSATSTT
jgi:catechol 2,3-dioxygenase-like lactoylglutathione lyase family enzyme